MDPELQELLRLVRRINRVISLLWFAFLASVALAIVAAVVAFFLVKSQIDKVEGTVNGVNSKVDERINDVQNTFGKFR